MFLHRWFLSPLLVVICPCIAGQAPQAVNLPRPWVQGAGLHVDANGPWRLQIMTAAGLLPSAPQGEGLPVGIQGAPVPSVLVHFAQLRPGLQRLADLGGGMKGPLLSTAAHGPRAGFYLRQAQSWLEQASPVLEPLAQREAWILHYGYDFSDLQDRRQALRGTALFIPGGLPTRTKLMLTLAGLNPFTKGVRSRKVMIKTNRLGDVPVEEILGAGGVLHLAFRPEGTWVADREAVLRAIFEEAHPRRLGTRPEWGRLAAAGSSPTTLASLWIIPRLAAGADFESAMMVLRHGPGTQAAPTRLLQAAPRGTTMTVALGAGPLAPLLRALTEPDLPYDLPLPKSTGYQDEASLSPQQRQLRQLAEASVLKRQEERKDLRQELARLLTFLEPHSLALTWHGWTQAPPLLPQDRERLVSFQKTGKWTDDQGRVQSSNPVGMFFNGRGEPGMTPSLAASIPLKPGRTAEAEASMKRLFQLSFVGQAQSRKEKADYLLRRIRTYQAFSPAWTVVRDTLVVGSDDRAVAAVAEGLLGRAPTLADLSSATWGAGELDGERLAQDLESLLNAYLRAIGNAPTVWWLPTQEGTRTADDAAAEVATTFGPFLGLVKQVGRTPLAITWGPSGFEARPR